MNIERSESNLICRDQKVLRSIVSIVLLYRKKAGFLQNYHIFEFPEVTSLYAIVTLPEILAYGVEVASKTPVT